MFGKMLGLGVLLSFRDLASKAMKGAEARMKSLSGATDRMLLQQAKFQKMVRVGGLMMLGGAGLLAGMGATVAKAASYQDTLLTVQAVSGLTNKEIAHLRDSFIELSAPLPISAEDLAKVAISAGKMGIASSGGTKAVEEFSTSIIKLSAISKEIPLEDLATGMGKILGLTELNTNELDKLSSAFAALASASKINAVEMVEASARMAGLATSAGFTAAEILAFAAASVDAGVKAQVAASSTMKILGLMFTRQSEFAKEMGISTEELAKIMREDAANAVVKLVDTMKKLPMKEQIDLMYKLGLRGIRVQAVLTGMTKAGVDLAGKMAMANREFEKGTLLQERFMALTKSLTAKIRTFTGTIGTLAIQFGFPLINPVTRIFDALINLFGLVTKLPPSVTKLISLLVVFAGTTMFVSGAVLTLVGMIGLFAGAWGAGVLAIKAFIAASLPVLGWIFAAVGAVYLLNKAWQANLFGIRAMVTKVFGGISLFVKGFIDGMSDMKVSENVVKQLSLMGLWKPLQTTLKIFDNVKSFFRGFISTIKIFGDLFRAILMPIFEKIFPQINQVAKATGSLSGGLVDSTERWAMLGEKIATGVMPFLTGAAIGIRLLAEGFFILSKFIAWPFKLAFGMFKGMLWFIDKTIEGIAWMVEKFVYLKFAISRVWETLKAMTVGKVFNLLAKLGGFLAGPIGVPATAPALGFQEGGMVKAVPAAPIGTPVPVMAHVGEEFSPASKEKEVQITREDKTTVTSLRVEIPLVLDGREIYRAVKNFEDILSTRKFQRPPLPSTGVL